MQYLAVGPKSAVASVIQGSLSSARFKSRALPVRSFRKICHHSSVTRWKRPKSNNAASKVGSVSPSASTPQASLLCEPP